MRIGLDLAVPVNGPQVGSVSEYPPNTLPLYAAPSIAGNLVPYNDKLQTLVLVWPSAIHGDYPTC